MGTLDAKEKEMAENLEWRWRQWGASTPPAGKRLILKMADAHDRITYAIGILDGDTGKIRYTAQEDKNGMSVVYWMALPE